MSKGHAGQLEGVLTGQMYDSLSIRKNNDCKAVKIHVLVILGRKKTSLAPLEVIMAPVPYSINRK